VIRVRGAALRYQTAIRGWDQRRLAQASGLSQPTVSRAMAGGRVHHTTLVRLAAALHRQKPIPELELLLDEQPVSSERSDATTRRRTS
jgi:transcriptional regulator with XRE-family HTH domain